MDQYSGRHNEEYSREEKSIDAFVAEHEEASKLEEELRVRQNDFLDVYSMYLSVHTSFAKNLLKRKAIELEVLDPSFEFDID